VLDAAAVLSDVEENELLGRIAALADASGVELSVVTMESTAPITPAEMAFWLVNHWRLGGPERLGLLLLVAVGERRIEVEVGYGLESALSDPAADAILAEVAPQLGENLGAGLNAAVAALTDRVAQARGGSP